MADGHGHLPSLRALLSLTLIVLLCGAGIASAQTNPPIKTVEKLSFTRESADEKGSKIKVLSVRCAASSKQYIYVCNFLGVVAGKKKLCAATYVHYKPGNTGRYTVNFWGQSWRCGIAPPVAPPVYPGDQGPKS